MASSASAPEPEAAAPPSEAAAPAAPPATSVLAAVVPAELGEGETVDATNVFRGRNFSDTADLAGVMTAAESTEKTDDGTELAVFAFTPVRVPAPRGVVVMLPGYLHNIDFAWRAWATEWTGLGMLVVGFNQPGMGSPGVPGLCESWDNYVENALWAVRHGVALAGGAWTAGGAPTLPVFLHGQSMGGAVAICATRKAPAAITGVLLSSPMCGIAPERIPNCCAVNVLRCLEMCCPQAPLVPQEDILEDCFKCKHALAKRREYNVTYSMPAQPRLRTGLQLLHATEDIQEHMADFAPPAVLLVQGSDDRVTDRALTRGFIAACGSGDRTHITYESAWHVLEMDNMDTRRAVIHDVTYWLATHVDAWEAANPSLARTPEEAAAEEEGAAAEEGAAGEGKDAAAEPAAAEPAAEPAAAAGEGKEAAGEAVLAPAAAAAEPATATPAAATHASAVVVQPQSAAADPALGVKEEGGVKWAVRPPGTGPVPDHTPDFVVIPGSDQRVLQAAK